MKTTYKIAAAGLYSALALITFTLENLLPPLFIPGARLGLSNIFIIVSALTLGSVWGFAVLAVKTVVGSLIAGNFSAVLYSLPAGIIALLLQLLAIRAIKCSVIAASVLGATVNITVQNTVFCLVAGAAEYFIYLPYLALISILSGAVTGFVVVLLLKKLPARFTGLHVNIKE